MSNDVDIWKSTFKDKDLADSDKFIIKPAQNYRSVATPKSDDKENKILRKEIDELKKRLDNMDREIRKLQHGMRIGNRQAKNASYNGGDNGSSPNKE
jgi:prefoldin subunit 5